MNETRFMHRAALGQLIEAMQEAGYRVIGPRLETGQGGIAFREINGAEDLPHGVVEHQSPGRYRLEIQPSSPRNFSWANAASAIKPYVFAPRERLWRAVSKDGRLSFESMQREPQKTAILGVRACDLAALDIQDAHFLGAAFRDPYYRGRREKLLLVAVNCSHAAATCFCASTGDGPEVVGGFDILLDELEEGFLLRTGTTRGAVIVADLPYEPASAEMMHKAWEQVQRCRQQQRALPPQDELPRLAGHLDDSRWQQIAERCLACGNCTAVCPTCFCHREFDVPALNGVSTEHWRDADTCFNADHSYIAGQVVHGGIRERYRQWMTHKLLSWTAQYGRTGCTGCGRCITWCPAGIDFAEEANILLARKGGAAC